MSLKKINIVIAGATGYVGLDLVNLLSKHPKVKITNLCAQNKIGKNIQFFDSRIKKKLPKISSLANVKWDKVDLLFLSLPNSQGQKIIKKLFYKHTHLKFIDLSADFRLQDSSSYKSWYKLDHKAKDLIKYSKYSISEFVKKDIKKFRIIANPGCYPTSIQLPLIPLLKKKLIKNKSIIIDSKSGYSGAGKLFSKKFNYKNLFSSFFSYGIVKHKHMSELDQEFSKHTKKKIFYTFSPHVIPTYRGLMSTMHLEKKPTTSTKQIIRVLKNFYKKDIFIKILEANTPVSTGNVVNTNNCEISVCSSRDKNKIVIYSVIDNLIKGASGQAIQNLNLMYGLNESVGLK
jgi:N-acetyl-gamma-glutamyl-phosphate reductase